MKAKVAENRSRVILAEAECLRPMADAFREGHFFVHSDANPGNGKAG